MLSPVKNKALQFKFHLWNGDNAGVDYLSEKPSTSTMEQDGYEDQLSPGGRRSKRDPKPNLDEDFMYDGIRRSTRQRKQLYDTFNEHLIDKKLQITGRMGIAREEQEKPKRKKARLMDSLDTTEEAEQACIKNCISGLKFS